MTINNNKFQNDQMYFGIDLSKQIDFTPCPTCLGTGRAKQFVAFAKVGGGSISKTKKIKCSKCNGTGVLK